MQGSKWHSEQYSVFRSQTLDACSKEHARKDIREMNNMKEGPHLASIWNIKIPRSQISGDFTFLQAILSTCLVLFRHLAVALQRSTT